MNDHAKHHRFLAKIYKFVTKNYRSFIDCRRPPYGFHQVSVTQLKQEKAVLQHANHHAGQDGNPGPRLARTP